jgi:hypothetical protein
MAAADCFREKAEALYRLAKTTAPAAERLELALEAMEWEARAVDAERGRIVPPYITVTFPPTARTR